MLKLKKLQVLDGTALKLIAMVSMVIDHVGAVFFPAAAWMRMVGRLAMPLFSFCVAEGFAHTRDKKKYLLRMGVFALLSEVPFDLAFEGRVGPGHQNIMLTFFLALLALTLYDRIRGGADAERPSACSRSSRWRRCRSRCGRTTPCSASWRCSCSTRCGGSTRWCAAARASRSSR